jgi:hypothetical protein
MKKLKKEAKETIRSAIFLITLHTISFGVAYYLATSFDKLFNKAEEKPNTKGNHETDDKGARDN